MFSPGFRKKRHWVGKFSTRLLLSVWSLFCLFQTHTNDIHHVGYVKVAPGKPQTGRVQLKISPGTGEAKFSLGEGKKSSNSGFTGSVTEGSASHNFILKHLDRENFSHFCFKYVREEMHAFGRTHTT